MIYALLATLIVAGVHCQAQQGRLSNEMLGDFILDTSEGFNNYMYEVGVDWFTRKVQFSQQKFVYIFKYFSSPDSLQPLPNS